MTDPYQAFVVAHQLIRDITSEVHDADYTRRNALSSSTLVSENLYNGWKSGMYYAVKILNDYAEEQHKLFSEDLETQFNLEQTTEE